MATNWIETMDGVQIGMGAVNVLWSDVEPCEVIGKTAKTVTVRRMDARLDPTWKPDMRPGGFSAITVNNHEQRWILESNAFAGTDTLRMTKKGWHGKMGKYKIGAAYKHHDYNF